MVLRTKYYTLIGSLPALPRHFTDAERTPLSELQLRERLRMLEPADAEVIDEMGEFLTWERQPLEKSDEDVIRHFDQFMDSVVNRFARELIQRALTQRTIIAGLRRRRLGLDPPLGLEPVRSQIARHWEHPDFRLGAQYPWIADIETELNGDSPLDLEMRKLELMWKNAARLAAHHFFTFEAVVLYLIRWEVIHRWVSRDAKAGLVRFERLATDAMGEFADMFD